MTDKEKIREKIEKDFVYYDRASIGNNSPVLVAKRNLCHDWLKYIDSLSEEPVSEDLEEAAKNHAVERYRTTRDKFLAEKCKWSFIAGAQWKEKQMMKDAIEGDILNSYYPTHIQLNTYSEKFNDGDKVKLIIVKED